MEFVDLSFFFKMSANAAAGAAPLHADAEDAGGAGRGEAEAAARRGKATGRRVGVVTGS